MGTARLNTDFGDLKKGTEVTITAKGKTFCRGIVGFFYTCDLEDFHFVPVKGLNKYSDEELIKELKDRGYGYATNN